MKKINKFWENTDKKKKHYVKPSQIWRTAKTPAAQKKAGFKF